MSLPLLGRLLDCRSAEASAVEPFADAANIPWDQLSERLGELPRKDELLQIAETSEGHLAAEFLERGGRRVQLAAPVRAETFVSRRLWRPSAFLEERVTGLEPGEALDLGCGAGRETAFLAALGWRVLAVDQNAEAVEAALGLARRWTPEAAVSGSVCPVSQVTQTADLVVCLYLHDEEALRHAVSLVRPGGLLAIEGYHAAGAALRGKPRSPLRSDVIGTWLEGWRVEQREKAQTAQILAWRS